MHGRTLDQRGTKVCCVVSGDPANSLCNASEREQELRGEQQQIWYGGSRTNAEGPLLDRAEKILAKKRDSGGPNAVAHSFTGADGIMMKSTIMEAFTSYKKRDGPGRIEEDGNFTRRLYDPRILDRSKHYLMPFFSSFESLLFQPCARPSTNIFFS